MITMPNLSQSAGIPAQWDDTVAATVGNFLTGDQPALFTQDVLFAPSTTFLERQPVGPRADGLWAPATDDVSAAVKAMQLFTLSGVGTAAETITIGSVTYTLRAAPTTVANEVKIGATAAETAANLTAAINGDAGAGTLYGSLTVEHPQVNARFSAAGVLEVVAKSSGTAGNAIATTDTSAVGAFGAATLAGGKDQIGVKAAGITLIPQVTPASPQPGGKVYRAGCFNPDMINWPASFDTVAKKMAAFDGAPAPTAIILRAPRAYTI